MPVLADRASAGAYHEARGRRAHAWRRDRGLRVGTWIRPSRPPPPALAAPSRTAGGPPSPRRRPTRAGAPRPRPRGRRAGSRRRDPGASPVGAPSSSTPSPAKGRQAPINRIEATARELRGAEGASRTEATRGGRRDRATAVQASPPRLGAVLADRRARAAEM